MAPPIFSDPFDDSAAAKVIKNREIKKNVTLVLKISRGSSQKAAAGNRKTHPRRL